MASLNGFWQFLNTDIKDIPWGELAEKGIEAVSASNDLGETWEEHKSDLNQLAPYFEKVEPFFKALSDPDAQMVISGLPFVSIGVGLLRIYLNLSKTEPTFESSVVLVAQLAYLQSLEAVLEHATDPDITEKLKTVSLKNLLEKQITRLDTENLTSNELKLVTSRFRESRLAGLFGTALAEQLQQAGLGEAESKQLSEQVSWGTPRYLYQAIAEAGESVEPLADFYRTGGQQEQNRYASIDAYLKNRIAPLPKEQVFDESDPLITFDDIYVPLNVQPLTQSGEKKEDAAPVNIHAWAQNLLEQTEPRKVMFIEGAAGQGKSVFCRMFAAEVGQTPFSYMPLFIRLRSLRAIENTLTETLENCPDLEPIEFVGTEGWLKNKNTRFLIILDGFDELLLQGRASGGLQEFLQQVSDFQERSHHQCLVTGRPLALQGIAQRITQNKTLERVKLEPMNDDLQEQWLSNWQSIFKEQEVSQFRTFLKACPTEIGAHLAREPLLIYLLARLHREKQLTSEMFANAKQESQAKLRVYRESVNWVLEKQRQDENLRLSGLDDPDDLREVLQEAALCVVQSGNETAQLSMLKARFQDSGNPVAISLKTAQDTTGQSEDKALNNLLTTFYLRPGERDKRGSMELAHKSFGKYLFAERLINAVEDWITLDRRKRFLIDDRTFFSQIYDLLGFGGLSIEVVEYLFGLLEEYNLDQTLLFARLHTFYQKWIQGEFLDQAPTENLPQKKLLRLRDHNIYTSLKQVDAFAGLNVLVILFELNKHPKNLHNSDFHPCGEPFTNGFNADAFLLITNNIEEFIRFLGPFLNAVNLSYANLERVNFRAADLSYANLKGANLNSADLNQTKLDYANLEGTKLNTTNFSEASMEATNLEKAIACKANFDKANLKNTNFSKANLRSASFEYANFECNLFKKSSLDGANLNGAYLVHSLELKTASLIRTNLTGSDLSCLDLREVNLSSSNLCKANLRKASLDNALLQGVNLSEVNLTEASLLNANLANANLDKADLTKANLKGASLSQVRALSTTFLETILTGACIKSWHIDYETRLEDVICDYVYLRGDKIERRPSNENEYFKSGDFSTLVRSSVETVDLIFQGGLNWQAFFDSFRELQQKYVEESLCVQSIERKESDFIVRLEVNSESDKGLIEQDATNLYQQQLKLLREKHESELSKYKSLMSKETEISKIYKLQAEQYQKQIDRQQQIISQAFNQPTNLHLEFNPTMKQSQGQSQPSRSIKSKNYHEVNLHDQSTYVEGNYYNSPDKQNLTEAAQEIRQLLQQLEQTYDPKTTSGRMQIATEAAKQIESNPSKMARILSALQAGGVSALEQLLNHPAASFFLAAAEDWQQTAEEKDDQNAN